MQLDIKNFAIIEWCSVNVVRTIFRVRLPGMQKLVILLDLNAKNASNAFDIKKRNCMIVCKLLSKW